MLRSRTRFDNRFQYPVDKQVFSQPAEETGSGGAGGCVGSSGRYVPLGGTPFDCPNASSYCTRSRRSRRVEWQTPKSEIALIKQRLKQAIEISKKKEQTDG